MLKKIIASFLILYASAAGANPVQDIRVLINSGDYETAQREAESLNTAQGYALAAESLSAQILLGEIDKLNKHAKEARSLSEKALALNPDLYDAQLQYALSDGFVTRTSGNMTAWRKKLPMKTYEKIENFRAAYPNDPRAIALEGAWHLGVVRKAGDKNAIKWFGASLSEGLRLYETARKLNPNDIMIETNYAMSLLVLDAKYYSASMKPILENISGLKVLTDMERKIQSRAAEMLSYYDNPKQMKKLAAKFLDGA